MKPFFFLLMGCCITTFGYTQIKHLPKQSIRFNIGKSTHGTDDLLGISFGAAYTHYIKKKLSLEYHFKGTIHDGEDTYLLRFNNSIIQDGSVRMTTAGFQLGSLIRYSPIRSMHHEFTIAAGPYGRFQSSSLGDNGYSVTYPQGGATYPLIRIAFDHSFPQRRYTIGYLTELSYSYTFKKGVFIGTNASFQNDTNADAITHLGLLIGKRF